MSSDDRSPDASRNIALDFINAHVGESLALLVAMTWAVAVILFKKSGETVHPVALNVFKNVLATALLVPTIWLTGEEIVRDVPFSEYGIYLLSGALGIGIGDTLFFKCLNKLGAGLSAIVVCLYSPVIITLSVLWLGETLSLWQVVGATMIVSAVLFASLEKNGTGLTRRDIVIGVVYGSLGQLVNGIGIVMIKQQLASTPVFWATAVRLVGGTVVLVLYLMIHPHRAAIMRTLHTRTGWAYTLGGSLMGAYISMAIWLGGMKYTQASIAAALNQTSNILVFILAAIFLKEKVTRLRILGIILAVSGAVLVIAQ
ncbi:MAG: DMT family transporter [bacterium]